jgi:thiamine biosynthesis lipoprotein
VGWQGLEVSPRRVRLNSPGGAITLNGIAQGFAADGVMAALRRHGVEHALVNTGEIATLGQRADAQEWSVGIQHPRRPEAYMGVVKLGGRCLATSGDYATTFSADFSRNHIFDPRVGQSPQHFSSVSVAAPNATLADALSTAAFVLLPEAGLRLVRSIPGADALLVFKDGRTVATEGFPELV